MVKILHFADAHINTANYGRRDSETGFPLRIIDFLNSLDEIVNCAIEERVDCVLFAGDAYKNNNPSPTFQREWEERILRLNKQKITTYLLVGNHDIGGTSKAHSLTEFSTFDTKYIHVIDEISLITTSEYELVCLPWVHKSQFDQVSNQIEDLIKKLNPAIPKIFLGHCMISGAKFSSGQPVELGADMLLSKTILLNSGFDYVALGHIHQKQNLNEDNHPPIVYSGSIERVDFGEANEKKYFVIAEIEQGETKLDWRELKNIRSYVDLSLELTSKDNIIDQIKEILPEPDLLKGAMIRLVLEYPWAWDSLIDEPAIRELTKDGFEFRLVKLSQTETSFRLPKNFVIGKLSETELLDLYWKVSKTPKEEISELNKKAQEIMFNKEVSDA